MSDILNQINDSIHFENIANFESYKKKVTDLVQSLPEGQTLDKTSKEIFQNLILKELDSFSIELEIKKKHLEMELFFSYEKQYLNLLKEYKEEIKFANAIQEDLRKERTKFFAENLKEVNQTLSETKVENNVTSMWIKELVNSYTKSLDLSNELVEIALNDQIGELKKESKSLNKR